VLFTLAFKASGKPSVFFCALEKLVKASKNKIIKQYCFMVRYGLINVRVNLQFAKMKQKSTLL
jgi:hypothetical protein